MCSKGMWDTWDAHYLVTSTIILSTFLSSYKLNFDIEHWNLFSIDSGTVQARVHKKSLNTQKIDKAINW